MRGRKPTTIELSTPERQGLEKLIKGHNTRQQIALRSRIILAAAEGKNNSQIAKEFQVTRDTARLWRGRWLTLQPISLEDLNVEERLENLPRPGAPAQSRPINERRSKNWPVRSRKNHSGLLLTGRPGKLQTKSCSAAL